MAAKTGSGRSAMKLYAILLLPLIASAQCPIEPPPVIDPPVVIEQPTGEWPQWRQAMVAGEVREVPAGNVLKDIVPPEDAFVADTALRHWTGGCEMPDGTFHVPRVGGHGTSLSNFWPAVNVRTELPTWYMVSGPTIGTIGPMHSYNRTVCVPDKGPMFPQLSNKTNAYAVRWNIETGLPEKLHLTTLGDGGSPWGYGSAYDPTRRVIYTRNSDSLRMVAYYIDEDTHRISGGSLYKGTSGNIAMVYDQARDIVIYASGTENSQSGTPGYDVRYWDAWTMGAGYRIESKANHKPQFTNSPVGIPANGDANLYMVGNKVCYWNQPEGFENTINCMVIPENPADPWSYESTTFAGDTVSARSMNGTFGKFFYDDFLKGFFLINAATEPFYFFAVE